MGERKTGIFLARGKGTLKKGQRKVRGRVGGWKEMKGGFKKERKRKWRASIKVHRNVGEH